MTAMTGLRQGELIALRWKDVDWKAGLIRVRRNYTRGRFGTPKTKRFSRSVPTPGRVAAALKERLKRSKSRSTSRTSGGQPGRSAPTGLASSSRRQGW
jgi:integrase